MKKLILTLTIIGLISALALAYIYQITAPLIEGEEALARKKAVLDVLPESDSYTEVVKNGIIFYEGNVEGEVAMSVSGGGFNGEIKLMIGANPFEGKIYKITVLNHSETPGLGSKITDDEFTSIFAGKPFGKYQVVKRPVSNPMEVEAISGATISSQAVTDIISDAVNRMRLAYGGGA
ncbi:MAG: FMN-binding protein [Halanaerobiaceae bacterium]|nr:FMN-binding protein [Halanaerobiaceae bacterium]